MPGVFIKYKLTNHEDIITKNRNKILFHHKQPDLQLCRDTLLLVVI